LHLKIQTSLARSQLQLVDCF